MNDLRIRLLPALVLALASGGATGLAAQERPEERACAELLPAIESLKTMLAQEAKARTANDEMQRMQVVMSLLTLRYRNIEALASSLRAAETEEDDIRSAMARGQAQIEAFDEAERNAATVASEVEFKAERAEIQATLKGLDEQANRLRARKANYQGQLALERRDIEKLEAVVRGWLEKTP